MTVSDLLNSLMNDAHRNGKPEVFDALKLLRDPIAALENDAGELAAIVLEQCFGYTSGPGKVAADVARIVRMRTK